VWTRPTGPQVAMHRLNIKPGRKTSQAATSTILPEIMEAIKSETKKLIDSSFVREEQYPDWVVNIIPVSRKNGKIRICIDFCDLNAAFRKDEFHLPIMNVMIDNMCGSERFHGQFFQCNQIKMYPDEEKYPFFRTLLGGTAIP